MSFLTAILEFFSAQGDSKSTLRRYTFLLVLIGILVCCLFSAGSKGTGGAASALSSGLAVMAASFAAAFVIGFIFAIPGTLQTEDPNPNAPKQGVRYLINRNIEQVSDWLTKITVGVGLVEFRNIADFLANNAANYSTDPVDQTFLIAIIIYSFFSSFLLGFLWTRLAFVEAIKKADISLTTDREEIDQIVQAWLRADAEALSIARRQLDVTNSSIDQETLNEKIKAASYGARVTIFDEGLEAANHGDPERAASVLIALIEADTDKRFDQNHAGLARCLMRQNKWSDAFRHLSDAIVIRTNHDIPDRHIYEALRAYCNIQLDASFHRGEATKDAARRSFIIDDLKTAAEDPPLRERFTRLDPNAQDDESKQLREVRSWMELNGVSSAEIGLSD